MKKLLLSLSFLLLSVFGYSQITFVRIYGGINSDYSTCVKQTSDGGYIITGSTDSFGAGDYDVYLIRTNNYGDTLWTRTYGGIYSDGGSSVQQTTDGGFIITGHTCNSFSSNNCDVYIIKTDPNGFVLWIKTYGGIHDDRANFIQQTNDGGFIIAGQTKSFGIGNYDFYLIRTASNGDSLWTKTFGGTLDDFGYSVQQTTEGGFIITGETDSFGLGWGDIYLIKTDENGDSIWTKTIGGPIVDRAWSVQQTTDEGYIITGTRGIGSNQGACLIKTDSNGTIAWTKNYLGLKQAEGYSVRQTIDGGYIIAGYTDSVSASGIGNDIYLIKTSSNGDTLWTKQFGGYNDEWGRSVQQTSDGGYIITGETNSFGAGSYDIMLIKTDGNGNAVGINSIQASKGIRIFPNPTTGKINIQIPEQLKKVKTL